MTEVQLEDLPDEIILKLLRYLGPNDLIECSLVSKRIGAISQEEYLRQGINVSEEKVPADFIEDALNRGCRYLSLHKTQLIGDLSLKNGLNLRYLDLTDCLCELGGQNGRNRIENTLLRCYR